MYEKKSTDEPESLHDLIVNNFLAAQFSKRISPNTRMNAEHIKTAVNSAKVSNPQSHYNIDKNGATTNSHLFNQIFLGDALGAYGVKKNSSTVSHYSRVIKYTGDFVQQIKTYFKTFPTTGYLNYSVPESFHNGSGKLAHNVNNFAKCDCFTPYSATIPAATPAQIAAHPYTALNVSPELGKFMNISAVLTNYLWKGSPSKNPIMYFHCGCVYKNPKYRTALAGLRLRGDVKFALPKHIAALYSKEQIDDMIAADKLDLHNLSIETGMKIVTKRPRGRAATGKFRTVDPDSASTSIIEQTSDADSDDSSSRKKKSSHKRKHKHKHKHKKSSSHKKRKHSSSSSSTSTGKPVIPSPTFKAIIDDVGSSSDEEDDDTIIAARHARAARNFKKYGLGAHPRVGGKSPRHLSTTTTPQPRGKPVHNSRKKK